MLEQKKGNGDIALFLWQLIFGLAFLIPLKLYIVYTIFWRSSARCDNISPFYNAVGYGYTN